MRIVKLALGIGCLFGMSAIAGCGQKATDQGELGAARPLEEVAQLGARRLWYQGPLLEVETKVKAASLKGEPSMRRLSFESMTIVAKARAGGGEKLFLAAGSGLSIYPYQNFDLVNVVVQAEDGTEFEADRLSWQRGAKGRSVILSGGLQIFTGEYLLEADTVKADAIFGSYLIPRLLSGKVLDEIEGAAGKD